MAIDLHGWRNTRGLTQVEAAEMLGVSQTYLSLLETGSRPLTKDLRSRLQALGNSREPQASQTERSFRPQLSALGYPGFRHVGASRRRATPGSLLLQALRQPDLDARVCEALPWVARQYAADVDWEWLVRHAKLHDFQNRLGFLLELAGTGTEPMARGKVRTGGGSPAGGGDLLLGFHARGHPAVDAPEPLAGGVTLECCGATARRGSGPCRMSVPRRRGFRFCRTWMRS